MSFNINSKLPIFKFLLGSKNFGKDDFKYLSQEFDRKVLDLVNQKGLYPYEHIEELQSKEKLYSSLTDSKS